MTSTGIRILFRQLAILSVCIGLTACATTGPQIVEDIGGLRKGVATTREEAKVAFEAANKLTREQALNRKLGDPSVLLKEDDFAVPVAPEDARAWDKAFAILDTYGAGLEKLVAPAQATGVGDAISGLANQLNTGRAQAGVPPTLVGVFGAFGSALTQAASERKATAIMKATDPAFQDLTRQMADAIGDGSPERQGLTGVIVNAKYPAVLAGLQGSYAGLKPAQTAERTKVLKDFAATLDRRDADRANLVQLRDSILALGEAHAAAAAGKPGDAKFWVERIQGWLDDVKARSKAAQKALEDAK